MDIAKEIKKMLIDEDITQNDLAERIETSQQNLNAKLKRNNFSIKEMQQIADALGYELRIEFIKNKANID